MADNHPPSRYFFGERSESVEEVFSTVFYVPEVSLGQLQEEESALRTRLVDQVNESSFGRLFDRRVYVEFLYRPARSVLLFITVAVPAVYKFVKDYKSLRDGVLFLRQDLRYLIAKFFVLPLQRVQEDKFTEGSVMLQGEGQATGGNREERLIQFSLYMSAVTFGTLLLLVACTVALMVVILIHLLS